jgi:signal transduction histidine kinase
LKSIHDQTRSPRLGLVDLDTSEINTSSTPGQAAIALELSDARVDQQRLGVLVDRWRIASDLHDQVIQRLFAAGLCLQSIASTLNDEAIEQPLTRTVEELDETIRQIRTTIFALQKESSRSLGGTALGLSISWRRCCRSVQTSSSSDRWTPDDAIIADVEAVLRESLTNVAKHAQATQIRVRVQADKERLDVTVIDDGVGLSGSTRRSGLVNLNRRACSSRKNREELRIGSAHQARHAAADTGDGVRGHPAPAY